MSKSWWSSEVQAAVSAWLAALESLPVDSTVQRPPKKAVISSNIKKTENKRRTSGLCSGTPQLIPVRRRDEFKPILKQFRGGLSSKVSSFTNPDKSFETYCRPSPQRWLLRMQSHKTISHDLQMVLRDYPPVRQF